MIRTAELFAPIDEQTVDALVAAGRVRPLYRDETLFYQGDVSLHFYLVLDGWLKIYRTNAEGVMTVRRIATPGETFGEPAAFAQEFYSSTAETASDARVLEIPGRAVMDAFPSSPSLARAVAVTLSRRLEDRMIELERSYHNSLPQRLAGFLAGMFDPCGHQVDLRLPYDKNILAARLGMRPESLSRAFLALREMGVRTHFRCVCIEDVQRLREFAGVED